MADLSTVKERLLPIARQARQGWRRRILADRRAIDPEASVVSLTFDDVPKSALTAGLPLLDRHGQKATFYVSTTFCDGGGGQARDYDDYLTLDDVTLLANEGHHIASHTHSHKHLVRGHEGEMLADSLKNVALLEPLIGGRITDFAFPYGEFTYRSKQVFSERFETLRGVEAGINQSPVDLRLLKSQMLAESSFSPAAISTLVDRCADEGGWLIFFSHDIAPSPTPWGIRPDQFSVLLEILAESAVEVLDVKAARQRLGL